MRTSLLSRFAISTSVTALLAGCSAGSQPPLGAPGAMSLASSIAPARTGAVRSLTASSYEVLHRFGRHVASHDYLGANPKGGLLDVDGVLYGTTEAGGLHDAGTVYSITTTGAKKTLYRFRGGSSDGVDPGGDLIDVNGTLFGTTSGGGTCGNGTVYSVSTSGTETVLHSFCGSDGISPPGASPLVNVNGTLYGTTFQGGGPSSDGWGTVYSISTSGAFKVLHAFLQCEGSGTQYPCGLASGLVYLNGVFYGTSLYGGTGCYSNGGCGTVYSVSMTGKEKLLYSFQGGSDGWFPESGLIDVNGTLYGMTELGGTSGCTSGGCGTIYGISTGGEEKVLYTFAGGSDGSNPVVNLFEMNGTFYGTTLKGGAANDGTVFSFTTSGGEQVLHASGGGSDGAQPETDLIEMNGSLYGTTVHGGTKGCGGGGCGTAFALTP
jgi:uncharacterized repeat protein (TIGR03803 family)